MKLGVRLYGTEPAGLAEAAHAAEALGYESVWRGDHTVIPEEPESDPYRAVSPLRAESPLLDPITVFAYLAGVTSTIRLGIGVVILPLRNPFLLAKALTTLDVLSQGRVVCGVGAGWLLEEFRLLGIDPKLRGASMDDGIQLLKSLWQGRSDGFDGRAGSYPSVTFQPPPAQPGGPPIIVGGESAAALRRAATLADGWYGHAQSAVTLQRKLEQLADLARAAGRASPVPVTLSVPTSVTEQELTTMRDLGVSRVVAEVGDINVVHARTMIPEMEAFRDKARRCGW